MISSKLRPRMLLQTTPTTDCILWFAFLWSCLHLCQRNFSVNKVFLIFSGKTRTKDKYRVVYTDHQRVELEKEFYYSRYITIRRKAELASNLGLSERQVKIWFQNRRAKERKQVKKREELTQKDSTPIGLHQIPPQTSVTALSQNQAPISRGLISVPLMWQMNEFGTYGCEWDVP